MKCLPKFAEVHNASDLAKKAMNRAEEVIATCGRPELTPGLAKLSFYRFIFLCGKAPLSYHRMGAKTLLLDDSISMATDDRFGVLKDTLQRVVKFATILQPEGISLRFLNYSNDRDFNDLKEEKDIMSIVNSVNVSNGTPLGENLDTKIVRPMIIDKAVAGCLEKPVIVVIITDGEASYPDSLNSI